MAASATAVLLGLSIACGRADKDEDHTGMPPVPHSAPQPDPGTGDTGDGPGVHSSVLHTAAGDGHTGSTANTNSDYGLPDTP